MPFDYEEYQKKCNTLTTEQLHKEWENYTRQIAGGATSTATSVLFSPLTAGISLVGLGLSAPRIHNARKKREIIEAGLQARGTTHNTRKRDVIAPMAVAGTLGGLTLGLAGPGADMIAGAAVGHGVEYAVSHTALDATGAVLEHSHDEHSKKKADEKLRLQYQNFQQQYIQEQAKLQSPPSQLTPQPGLHIIPPAPQHSRPGTPQPGQISQSQLGPNSGLQMPPPIPQHSRPGTPQPGQTPQYQPQLPGQDQKYEYVPVPAAHSSPISYQSASHQQQFTQSLAATQAPETDKVPQYQPIQQPEKYLVTVSSHLGNVTTQSYLPEKTAAYASTAAQNGPSGSSPCPSPLPQYSSQESAPLSQNGPQELSPSRPTSTAQHPNGHPNMHIDLPPAPPTMEEEILFLKARLIQLEIEKREAAAQQASPTITQPTVENISQLRFDVGKEEPQPSLTLTPPSASQSQSVSSQQYFHPPPASPAMPPGSPSMAPQQFPPPPSPVIPPRSPNLPPQQFPPPPPVPHTQLPPPPPLPQTYTYQPQNYPLPPPSPNAQQQPQFQRHDSGYYSNAPTPSPSNRLSQSYIPSPTGYSIPSQSTGSSQHSHNPSISSYQPSPMSPAPPPYQPALSAVPTVSGKDYFGQGPPPSSPNTGGAQIYQGQSTLGTQGWQWGTSAPVGAPNQFPPPPPSTWRA